MVKEGKLIIITEVSNNNIVSKHMVAVKNKGISNNNSQLITVNNNKVIKVVIHKWRLLSNNNMDSIHLETLMEVKVIHINNQVLKLDRDLQ